jgi:hypothetical protein
VPGRSLPRTYPRQVPLSLDPPTAPAAYEAGLVGLRALLEHPPRADVLLSEVPAPKRLAPYAVAVAAEVLRGGEEVASGRFVVLHDPEGQEGWRGDTRVVAFVQADVEAEMAADPALGEVGWSWLTEALAACPHTAAGGTVTRTASSRFGQIAEPVEASEVEVRASWTPLPGEDGALDLAAHLTAWCALLCATAGLPPPGVSALRT